LILERAASRIYGQHAADLDFVAIYASALIVDRDFGGIYGKRAVDRDFDAIYGKCAQWIEILVVSMASAQ